MNIRVRPLAEADLPAADRINRAAFAKFFGLPGPDKFRPGADVIGPRWRTWPEAGLIVDADGKPVAAALMMDWGSIAVLGPVTVAPEFWSKGVARTIMPALIELIDRGAFAFTGLFTHPQSPKHIRLYESFGFYMQRVTAVMTKAVAVERSDPPRLLSTLDGNARKDAIVALRRVTDAVFAGLDLSREIAAVAEMRLGDTVLIEDGRSYAGFAVCHHGRGSEASDGQLYVKFGAALSRPGFSRLLAACEALATARGAAQIVAGTNTGRFHAYQLMQQAGFRTAMNGVAMTRPATDGYNRPDSLVIDDWR